MNRHTPERSGWSELGGITNYKWQKQFEEQWGILHNRYGKRDLLREWPETTAKVMKALKRKEGKQNEQSNLDGKINQRSGDQIFTG